MAEKERKNIAGMKFGYLTAIEYDHSEHSKAIWRFKCDCGKEILRNHALVENGNISSCGCKSLELNSLHNIKYEEEGTIYGYLKIIQKANPFIRDGKAYWTCECLKCGSIKDYCGTMLRCGNIKSCGCLLSWKEEEIVNILTQYNFSFKRQYTFSDLFGNSNRRLRFDFALLDEFGNLKGLVEYHGRQHFQSISRDKEGDFELRQLYDKKKEEYCKKNHIPLLILTQEDNLNEELLKFYYEV